jgi:predicted transcriptional regulator
MPYDSSLDHEWFSRAAETDAGRIVVSVHSYNNGAKKLQITREVKDREGKFIFAKLGRMSKEELDEVMPLIGEARKLM